MIRDPDANIWEHHHFTNAAFILGAIAAMAHDVVEAWPFAVVGTAGEAAVAIGCAVGAVKLCVGLHPPYRFA